jgi:hypothetical protein
VTAARVRETADLAGLVAAALDERQQARQRATIAAEGGLEQLGR